MDLAGDEAVLFAMADALRDCPKIVESSGPAVADAMLDALSETASNAQSAEGRYWQLTKDGERPLKNALAHIQKRSGPRVAQLVIRGHYALHDLGRARGGVVRSILPVVEGGKIAAAIIARVDRRLIERIDRVGR